MFFFFLLPILSKSYLCLQRNMTFKMKTCERSYDNFIFHQNNHSDFNIIFGPDRVVLRVLELIIRLLLKTDTELCSDDGSNVRRHFYMTK